MTETPVSRTVRHGQRRDIEGLRAVAVLLVVADHLFGAPRGGFVGVDVFFVISGFLISGMLVDEFDRTGAISFRNFYARRVRRILPAAVLTLILTCLVAHALFFEARARQTFVDAGWAAISTVNWHFAITGTDYFQSTLPPSAVQQYWSLSVEEQFYVVWPGLIILSGLLARLGRRKRFRETATIAFCVVILSSLAWALFQSRTDTTVAYFSTLTRGWELGAGALAAMVAPRLRHLSAKVSTIVTVLGLAAITFAALMTRSDATFPAPGALPAVVGTLAVILSGCSRHAPYNPLLMNPVSGFVGRISYSIYLVHWPIIIFSEALVRSAVLRPVLVCAATLLFATLSYQLIEQPIRHTTWLSRPSSSRARRGLSLRAKRGYTLALSCVAIAALVQGLAVHDVAPTQAATMPVAQQTVASGSGSTRPSGDNDAVTDAWRAQIQAAISARSWPALKPSLDKLATSRAAEWHVCGNVTQLNMNQCRFGNKNAGAAKTVVVLGDSEAISWIPAIRAAYEGKGWFIQGLTYGECTAARIDVVSGSGDTEFTRQCAEHQKFALRTAARMHPALIVMSSTEETLSRLAGIPGDAKAGDLETAEKAFSKAEEYSINQLKRQGTAVVILSPPPIRSSLEICATKLSSPTNCVSTIKGSWEAFSTTQRAVARSTGARYVDTSSWTCTTDGVCPSFIGTTPVMADGVHLTDAMSRRLAPLLYRAVSG